MLAGSAAEFERELPFSVWVDALDAYVAVAGARPRRRLGRRAGRRARRRSCPSLRRDGGASAPSLADERYRAHRAVRALLELLAGERPLVLVLDDLHWTDDASIELLAALLRRGPDAPVLLALALPPRAGADAPARRARGRRRSRGIALEPARARREAARAARRARRRAPSPRSTATAAATRSTSSSSRARPRQPARGERSPERSRRRPASRPPSRRRSPRSSRRCSAPPSARCSRPPPSRASRSSPTSRRRSPSCPPAEALDALDALLALDLVRPTAGAAPLRLPPPARAPRGLRGDARRLAARGPRARGRRRSRRAAPAPTERAHHVEQSAAPGRRGRRSRCCSTAGAASGGRARRRPRRAGSRPRCGCCPRATRARQVDVRVALASALRVARRARALPRHAARGDRAARRRRRRARRVELTARCAAVEHWLGRHDDAHRRLAARVGGRCPTDRTPAGRRAADRAGGRRALRARLRADASRWAAARSTPRARGRRPRADRRGGRRRCASARRRPGGSTTAREHRAEALGADRPALRRRAGAAARGALLPRLGRDLPRALRRRGRARRPRDRDRAGDRRGAAARAADARARTTRSRCRAGSAEAIELLRGGARGRAALGEPARALPGAVRARLDALLRGRPRRRDRRLRGERARRTRGWPAARCPNGGGGPGWGLGVACFEAGEVERGAGASCSSSAATTLAAQDARRALLRLGEPRARRARARATARPPTATCAAPRSTPRELGLQLPAALALRARAAVLLAAGEPLEAARPGARRRPRPPTPSARGCRPRSRAASQGARSPPPASARAAIAALREAERELDACGSVRVRDEMRRELRRLGARAEPRGPATGGRQRHRVADASASSRSPTLVTDRKTNREIAAALFLSDKTVESHMRNIFVKLGVSSRVEVARAVERERRAARRVTHGVTARRAHRSTPTPRAWRELGYPQELVAPAATSSTTRRSASPRSRRSSGCTPSCSSARSWPGPAWVWVLPVALAGQCLLLAVYAELASEFPVAGGAYQWSRRLMGGAYGWISGWVAICAYAVANTTIAYLGAPWALTLARHRAHARTRSSSTGMVLVVVCALVGALGVDVLGRAIRRGHRRRGRRLGRHRARAAARLPRRRTSRSSTHTLGAEALSGGSVGARDARRARRRRLGLHRLRRLRRRPPRRRAAPRATSRARSGSRC